MLHGDIRNTDFSRMVGTTAIKLTGMTVPPVSNQRQGNCNCTVRLTMLFALTNSSLQQLHNSKHARTFAERGLHSVYPYSLNILP